jgi:hypothetical protein
MGSRLLIALALLSFISTLATSRYAADRRPYDQPDREASR